ncbi:MAG: surface-adhesin E family protein [Methylococcales bacterium]
MKKLTLLLLLLFSTNVFAEWTLIESATSEDGFDVYVDIQSKRKEGDKVKMWNMYDYKKVKVDVKSYLASVSHVEYDCKGETLRLLDLFWYTGNMGQGVPVFSNTNIKKDPISIMPETMHESLFNIACDRK